MKNYVITVARGFGSGGKQIAVALGKELGIPCYERQILTMASQKSGINENLFAEVDEKLRGSYLTKMLTSVPNVNIIEPSEKGFTSDNNLYKIQCEIIKSLARTESCIIVGKCADYVLKEYPNVTSVYIEAPRVDCVRSIMEKMSVTEEEAHRLIRKTDKYRASYYKYYTHGGEWTNPVNYDMTLNSARIGREKCVKVIKDYIKTKFDIEQ